MKPAQAIPSFDDHFAALHAFILELVTAYQAGSITSWNNLEEKVGAFFNADQIDEVEALAPGWRKMASYDEGVTLVHVMCVFLGLYMMPEFLNMTPPQQQMMKWIILLHDIEKEPQKGKRDHGHAFRSATTAAKLLPRFGFFVTPEYDLHIDHWSDFTRAAVRKPEDSPDVIQDNAKLPEILDGIERMFGPNTPASLIIKTILLHLSIGMEPWPPAAPLRDEEVSRYIDPRLVLLLRVMNLGDGEGWNLFKLERESLRNDTLKAFQKVERLISS